MSLEVESVSILTRGDFSALISGQRDGDVGGALAPLAAWFYRERVPPALLHICSDATCRFPVRSGPEGDAVGAITNNACERLKKAFPNEVFPL